MKFVIILSQVCLVFGWQEFHLGRSKGGNIGAPDGLYDNLPKPSWFLQKLDHFSPTNTKQWKQRFFVNDTFFDYNNPGPIFLMIGGEGTADPRWLVKGTWIDYAKDFKALCINLEHRYYGESHPTSDLSVKNLMYLSSEQALADLAYFIKSMNNKYKFPSDVKWVAFGGSYPGSLAAWVRLKYPHLVHAAVSSSGPLLAKVNFAEYFKVVAAALTEKTGDENCVNNIKEGHKQLVGLMANNMGREIIKSKFRICKDSFRPHENEVKNFYDTIAGNFANVVQYNEDNRFTTTNLNISEVCNIMAKPDLQAYQRLAALNSRLLDNSNQSCLDASYHKMIQNLRQVDWKAETSEGGRQWLYQTCTEFGFYQTSSDVVEMFGSELTVDFYIQQCEHVFGRKFNKKYIEKAAEWTNNNYGELNIRTSRVVFVHGSVDPWHALGITETRDELLPAIYIKGTAHCANMYPASENDLSALKDARVQIKKHLKNWLKEESLK